MKKIILFALLLASSFAIAQKDFEGTIEFELKYMGEGTDQMAAFMPTKYTYLFKQRKMKMITEGGMMAAMMGEILVDGDKGTAYILSSADKTAYTIKTDTEEGEESNTPKITKMDEIIKIAGYDCQKYLIESEQAGQTIRTTMWVTNEIAIKKPKKNKKVNMGNAFV